ncbi:DUF6011 domain-containing protein [Microlunatus sp. Y2014]|uniref:DUF6011 domain-containing protein n=1 Tax=Microlunatus sp. Y2014 TaxID=3418488 RepID=UPI003DA71387
MNSNELDALARWAPPEGRTVWQHMADILDELQTARCRRCNRRLRTVESVIAGIGPVCIRREAK